MMPISLVTVLFLIALVIIVMTFAGRQAHRPGTPDRSLGISELRDELRQVVVDATDDIREQLELLAARVQSLEDGLKKPHADAAVQDDREKNTSGRDKTIGRTRVGE